MCTLNDTAAPSDRSSPNLRPYLSLSSLGSHGRFLISIFVLPLTPTVIWGLLYLRARWCHRVGTALAEVHRGAGHRLRAHAIRLLAPMPEEDPFDFPVLSLTRRGQDGGGDDKQMVVAAAAPVSSATEEDGATEGGPTDLTALLSGSGGAAEEKKNAADPAAAATTSGAAAPPPRPPKKPAAVTPASLREARTREAIARTLDERPTWRQEDEDPARVRARLQHVEEHLLGENERQAAGSQRGNSSRRGAPADDPRALGRSASAAGGRTDLEMPPPAVGGPVAAPEPGMAEEEDQVVVVENAVEIRDEYQLRDEEVYLAALLGDDYVVQIASEVPTGEESYEERVAKRLAQEEADAKEYAAQLAALAAGDEGAKALRKERSWTPGAMFNKLQLRREGSSGPAGSSADDGSAGDGPTSPRSPVAWAKSLIFRVKSGEGSAVVGDAASPASTSGTPADDPAAAPAGGEKPEAAVVEVVPPPERPTGSENSDEPRPASGEGETGDKEAALQKQPSVVATSGVELEPLPEEEEPSGVAAADACVTAAPAAAAPEPPQQEEELDLVTVPLYGKVRNKSAADRNKENEEEDAGLSKEERQLRALLRSASTIGRIKRLELTSQDEKLEAMMARAARFTRLESTEDEAQLRHAYYNYCIVSIVCTIFFLCACSSALPAGLTNSNAFSGCFRALPALRLRHCTFAYKYHLLLFSPLLFVVAPAGTLSCPHQPWSSSAASVSICTLRGPNTAGSGWCARVSLAHRRCCRDRRPGHRDKIFRRPRSLHSPIHHLAKVHDMSQRCFEGRHLKNMLGIGVPGLCVVVGVPAYVIYVRDTQSAPLLSTQLASSYFPARLDVATSLC